MRYNFKITGTDREQSLARYRWEAPAQFKLDFMQSVLERGGWVDDLEQIPTIVLGE